MLGAAGVWVGTRFLATPEAGVSDAYKDRVVRATADDTVLTDVFDLAGGRPWPDGVSGRAVRNRFADRWAGREDELRRWSAAQRAEYLALGPELETEERSIWAGEGASLVTGIESAGDVVRTLARDAASILASRPPDLLRPG